MVWDSGQPELVETLTGEALRALVAKHEVFDDVQVDEDQNVHARLLGMRVCFFMGKNGSNIQFHFAVAGTNATMDKVNAWNRSKRYSRAYLDEEGDPHLELDLDLEGGLTEARIADFIRTSVASYLTFVTEVCG